MLIFHSSLYIFVDKCTVVLPWQTCYGWITVCLTTWMLDSSQNVIFASQTFWQSVLSNKSGDCSCLVSFLLFLGFFGWRSWARDSQLPSSRFCFLFCQFNWCCFLYFFDIFWAAAVSRLPFSNLKPWFAFTLMSLINNRLRMMMPLDTDPWFHWEIVWAVTVESFQKLQKYFWGIFSIKLSW